MTTKDACRDLVDTFKRYKEFIGCTWSFDTTDISYCATMESAGSWMKELLGDDLIYSSFTVMVTNRGEIMINLYFARNQGRRMGRVLDDWYNGMRNSGFFSYVYITKEDGSTSASIDYTVNNVRESNYTEKRQKCLEGLVVLFKLMARDGLVRLLA